MHVLGKKRKTHSLLGKNFFFFSDNHEVLLRVNVWTWRVTCRKETIYPHSHRRKRSKIQLHIKNGAKTVLIPEFN